MPHREAVRRISLDRAVDSSIGWVIQHRALVLTLTVLATLFMASGLRHVSLTASYKSYLSEYNRHMQMLQHLEDEFVSDEGVLVVVHPKDGTIYTPGTLGVLRELTEAAWQLPAVIRVDSLNNYPYTRAQGDDLAVDDLVPADKTLSATDLAAIKAAADGEPQISNLLAAADGSAAGISILFSYDDLDIVRNVEVEQAVRDLLTSMSQRHPDLAFYHTGITTAHADTVFMALHDLTYLFSVAAVLVLLGLYVFLRSVTATAACILIIVLTVSATAGLVGYTHTPFTLLTSSSPVIIMTLAVADSIHILMSILRLMREGMDKQQAILESYRINFLPVLLTTLTTAIGFLTFNFSVFAPLVGLGNIVCVGISLAFIYSIVFLPALLASVPLRVAVGPEQDPSTRLVRSLSPKITRYAKPLVVTTGLLGIVMTALLPSTEIRDSYLWYFHPDSVFSTGSRMTEELLTGSGNLIVGIDTGESGGIHDPEFLQRVAEFTEWLKQRRYVRQVTSYTDVIKRINMNMHGDDPSAYRLPQGRELAAQYTLLYEFSLPFGADLTNQINMDKSGLRLVAAVDIEDSVAVRRAIHELEDKLESLFPSERTDYAGASTLINYYIYDNMMALIASSITAFVIIGLCLMLAFRSIVLGLIGLTGVITPLVLFFGAWAVLVGYLGLGASLVVGIAIGIVVDNSVHLISKFNYFRRQCGDPPTEAVHKALDIAGPALLVNTLVLGLGFAILILAQYAPNATLGLMTSITFVLALLVSFFLVAPLLSIYRPPARQTLTTLKPAEHSPR